MNTGRSPEREPFENEDDVEREPVDPKQAAEAERQRQIAAERELPEDPHDDEGEGDGKQDDEAIAAGESDEAAAEERRARQMGWAPRNEWRGDPDKWVSASDFLDKAAANRPVMNDRLDRIERRMASQTKALEDSKSKIGEMADVLQHLRKANTDSYERGYKRAKAELEQQRDSAVEAGDVNGYREANKKIADLDAEHAEQAAPSGKEPGKGKAEPGGEQEPEQERQQQQRQRPQELDDWMKENAWYQADDELASAAGHVENRILREQPKLPLRQRLDLVAEEIRRRYPERFENPRRRAPPSVNGGGSPRRGGSTKQSKISDLPAAEREQARIAFDKIKRTLPDYTEAEYVRDYQT